MKIAALYPKVARARRATAKNDRVELAHQLICRIISPDVSTRDEPDTFLSHQANAALNDCLFELHVRDAVHQKPADAVCALKDSDEVTGAVELCGAGQPRRAGAD